MQQRIDDAQRAEQAAQETRDFADKQGKQADQRSRDVQKQKLEQLENETPQPNSPRRWPARHKQSWTTFMTI